MKCKKIISMATICVMLAGLLAGCGQSGSNSRTDDKEEDAKATQQEEQQPETQSGQMQSEAETQEETEAGDDGETTDAGSGGKTLVVYYSASGNTEEVAGFIAETMDADLFELEPAEAYSDADLDWTDDNSRVSVEHENPDEREVELVSATPENWESYDTVFIGYPIWWGIAAWPVDGFIKANDFTGKTVVPFCTSASSGLGESGTLLEEMAGTGDWQEGERFRSGASEEDVRTWVQGLGL